jgi:hypothetical protein
MTWSTPSLSRSPDSSLAQVRELVRTKLMEFAGAAVERALGTAVLASDGTSVIEGTSLTTEMLESLFTNRSLALHIRGFCPPSVCEKVTQFALSGFDFTNWSDSFNTEATENTFDTDMFYGVGLAATVILQSVELRTRYFAEATPTMRNVRAAVGDTGLGPTDRLRLELDDLWPSGARIKLHDTYRRKMLAGVGRLMKPSGLLGGLEREGVIHVDSALPLSSRKGLFSANVYVTVPGSGGELAVWNIQPSWLEVLRNRSYFELFNDVFTIGKTVETQDKIRSRLPPPTVLAPAQGDLIIFNSARPHAVRGFGEPVRLTFQTFIDYAEGRELQFFA